MMPMSGSAARKTPAADLPGVPMSSTTFRPFVAACVLAAALLPLRHGPGHHPQHHKHPSDQPYPGGMLSVHVDMSRAPSASSTSTRPSRWPARPDSRCTTPSGSRRARADRPDQQRDRPDHHGQRQADSVAARHCATCTRCTWTCPRASKTLHLSFQFLSPGNGGQFGASPSTEQQPGRHRVQPGGVLPGRLLLAPGEIQPTVDAAGWLEVRQRAARGRPVRQRGRFKPVSFNNFVDSPLIAGEYFKRVDLAPGAKVPVHLNIVGDSAKSVQISKKQIDRAPQPGHADPGAVRQPPLPPLRLPADAVGPRRPLRPGAPPVQRRPPARRLPDRQIHRTCARPR